MSSTFTSSSSSTASSSPISNSGSSSGDSKRLVITGVILGILGAIGVGLILWWTMRMKPKVPYEEEASEPASRPRAKSQSHSRTTSISTRRTNITRKSKSLHLANAPKITPFNPLTSQDVAGPRFVHTPGTNMRIATRLSNGIWQFSEPQRGLLGQSNPFEPSLQVLLDQRTRSPSPGPTYLSPISTYSPTNPFSDPNAVSPIDQRNPFSSHADAMDLDTKSASPTTTFKPYPFTRPGALTASRTQTQAQSVYRGTIYDLQKLHSIYSPSSSTGAGTLVPAGIHDLDDEIRAHKGKPLPVAESELMRRGTRNSLGAATLLMPSRQNSNDSAFSVSSGNSRRSAGSAQVLLGATGPVGLARSKTTRALAPYHPDLDKVIDVAPPGHEDSLPSMTEKASLDSDTYAEDANRDRDTDTPVSGGVRLGSSPYRVSEAYTFIEGHGIVPPYAPMSETESESHSRGHTHARTATATTDSYSHNVAASSSECYPHTIPSSESQSAHALSTSTNAYASSNSPYNTYAPSSFSASTVYMGSLGHFTRSREGIREGSISTYDTETETTNTHARDREMQRIRVEHPDTRSLDHNAASASVAGFPTSPSSFATTFAASSSLTHDSESSSAYTGSKSSRAPGKQIAGHTQTHSVTMLTLPSNGSHASGFPASPSSMATSFTYAQSHSTHAHTDLGTETETDGHTLISHSESASEAGYGYGYKSGLGKDKGSKETGTETESVSETHGYGFSTRYSAVPAGEKDQRFDSDSEERSEDTHTGDGDFISSYMEEAGSSEDTHTGYLVSSYMEEEVDYSDEDGHSEGESDEEGDTTIVLDPHTATVKGMGMGKDVLPPLPPK